MATRWIDFTSLKHQVAIQDVLARYGFLGRLQSKRPGKLIGACPIHGGKNGTSFNVDTEKNVFHCFSQCGGGNVLDLVMKIEKCTIREAGVKLSDWFGLQFERRRRSTNAHSKDDSTMSSEPDDHPVGPQNRQGDRSADGAPAASAPTRAEARSVNPPLERPLRYLNPDHPYLVARGLTIPTITTFGVGYCTRGLMRGRIAIPIHDERAELVAYAGRSVDQELAEARGKYRVPDGFKKSLVLFNLHRAKKHAARGLIVVEGFFDAMKLHQAGHPNVVALMGSTVSREQEELLSAHTDRLALMFDGDEAGIGCLRQFYGSMRRRLYLKEIHLEDGCQPDALSEERIRTLLS